MKMRLWRSRYSQWGQSQPGVEVWRCCRPQAGLSRWNLRPTRWGNIEVSISFSIRIIIFTKIRFCWIPTSCRQLRCKRMFAHCDILNYFDHCAALHAFLCQLFHHVMQRWSEADSLMVTQASLQHGPITREGKIQWRGVEMGVGVRSVVGEGARVRVGKGEGGGV